MPADPSPDLVRAVRAGCKAIGEPSCAYPDCECSRVRAIRAALAELEKPSDEMLDAGYAVSHPIDGAIAYGVVEVIWSAMMRRMLGDGGGDAG